MQYDKSSVCQTQFCLSALHHILMPVISRGKGYQGVIQNLSLHINSRGYVNYRFFNVFI